jgi:hypothetical protein
MNKISEIFVIEFFENIKNIAFSWNGFTKSNNSILDGSNVSLTAKFDKLSINVNMEGYACIPDGFGEGSDLIVKAYDELLSKAEESFKGEEILESSIMGRLPRKNLYFRNLYEPTENGAMLRLADCGDITLPSIIRLPAIGKFSIGRVDTALGVKQSDFEFAKEKNRISRRHAVFSVGLNEYTITDVGSTAGTWVNGQRISPNKPVSLVQGDRIRFADAGDYIFEATIAELTSLYI